MITKEKLQELRERRFASVRKKKMRKAIRRKKKQ